MDVELAPGALVLENGRIFGGYLFGAGSSAKTIKDKAPQHPGYGEVVFNTSMTGYQEILTDPSYFGQMICMTAPHIGNTGINFEDQESKKIWASGFIIHELSEIASNWRSKQSLEEFLKKQGVPGLCGVDTRALTRHLRSQGVTRGVIVPVHEQSQAKKLLTELPPFSGRDLIREVTTRESYFWNENTSGQKLNPQQQKYKVVAIDYGVKSNLLRLLVDHGCAVEVVSAQMEAKEILNKKPDGVFLSNGPGDPEAAPYAKEIVRGLLGNVPIFGVCMGHQILALAMGAKTYKLKFGHRGGNQPVLDQTSGKVEISSHNHGYAVDEKSLPVGVRASHINLNDKTLEGLDVPDQNAFSVQYHPEASPGPHDSMILFRRFVDNLCKAQCIKNT